jgi:hypothetical protein
MADFGQAATFRQRGKDDFGSYFLRAVGFYFCCDRPSDVREKTEQDDGSSAATVEKSVPTKA